MAETDDTGSKVHYICQTYVENRKSRDGQVSLKIDRQFQYTTAREAEMRAEREAKSENCAGADAYMVVEDQSSGEVGPPEFIARFGSVPDLDET